MAVDDVAVEAEDEEAGDREAEAEEGVEESLGDAEGEVGGAGLAAGLAEAGEGKNHAPDGAGEADEGAEVADDVEGLDFAEPVGDLFGGGRGRLRATELAQQAMGCKPYSNFNLVGAAQVGKSSLSGMRVLHQMNGRLPVWPIDPLPEAGSVVVEVYTTIAAMAAGRSAAKSKIRTLDELNQALAALGSDPVPGTGLIDDHKSDAILTAAWLRGSAHRQELWQPSALTGQIARTEGWTFGAK